MRTMPDDERLILYTAKQLASSLLRAYFTAANLSRQEQLQQRTSAEKIHFHDASGTPVCWNDVQAILAFKELTGKDIPVPLVATEGNNQHYHTSPYDGGWMPGSGCHDHRDNFNGGFAFAVYHPGTALPQQPWALY